MNNGLDNKEMPASSGGEDAVPVVIQNGSTKNLEAALVAIGNAGFGDKPIKISVIMTCPQKTGPPKKLV